jgi:hypothetical protein
MGASRAAQDAPPFSATQVAELKEPRKRPMFGQARLRLIFGQDDQKVGLSIDASRSSRSCRQADSRAHARLLLIEAVNCSFRMMAGEAGQRISIS